MWDELPSADEPRRPRIRSWGRFISEAGAATATFLLSATVFAASGLSALRGPEIKVLPPDHIRLYRDGVGDKAVLSVAVDAKILNEASREYGDVMTASTVSLGTGATAPSFRLETLVDMVLSPTPRAQARAWVAEQVRACRVGTRCVPTENLLVIETPAMLLDVPGAGSRSETLGFLLVDYKCAPETAPCRAFRTYEQSVAWLKARERITFTLALHFNNDGEKRIVCRSDRSAAEMDAVYTYLEMTGWADIPCDKP